MMNIDPRQLAEVQKTTKFIKAKIRINYPERTLELSMVSAVPESDQYIPQMLSQLADGFAQQLSAFFEITGEIIEVGKTE